MSYIGSPPASQFFAPGTDTFSGDGTTVAFTLSRNVATVNDILVVVNNVDQQPTAYSVLGSTLTFTAAPSSGTNNIYVRYLSTNLQTIAPQQGSVYPSSLSTQNAVYWDTSGNVGINTTTPSTYAKFAVVAPTAQYCAAYLAANTFSNYYHTAFYNDTTQIGYQYSDGTNFGLAATGASAGIVFLANGSERARVTGTGGFLVGATSYGAVGVSISSPSASGYYSTSAVTTAIFHLRFANPNGAVGSITTTGTATAYATSSDYRLKENVQPMVGALAKVEQLKPCTYNWKSDGSSGEGFIAHELQSVIPNAVIGEKDAVDAEGNPSYQGVDTSFLVATLTAAIQEQQAMIEELKTKVAALEAR